MSNDILRYTIYTTGNGGSRILIPLPTEGLSFWKSLSDSDLEEMIECYLNSETDLPEGLETELPVWSERALVHVLGVDLSDSPSIAVLDSSENEIELPEGWFDEAIVETRETYRSELPADGLYLIHAELENLGVRYDIETNKPFDFELLKFIIRDFEGTEIIEKVMYDGEEVHLGCDYSRHKGFSNSVFQTSR